MKRVLAVDDEKQITRMLRASLQSSGYAVTTANNGMEGFTQFESTRPDLIITDLAMPEMNGLELTQAVRRVSATPIIVLSVRDTDAMKVTALDEGADDYLTKPFSMPELLARVRALLRRTEDPAEQQQPRVELGHFVLDAEAHTVALQGEALHLTPKEFDLLAVLLRNAGKVMTHKTLLRAVWGPAGEGQPEYLRVLIGQLRKKLDKGGANYILSEPWVGYRVRPDGDAAE